MVKLDMPYGELTVPVPVHVPVIVGVCADAGIARSDAKTTKSETISFLILVSLSATPLKRVGFPTSYFQYSYIS